MRVLVVEDDALLASGLRELLEGAGHEVCVEEDGPAAVERGIAEPFDLLLLDLMLPGFDGLEVCTRIRTARPGVPVIMLTAQGHEEDKVRGLKRGADDYVTKPFGARELLARIDAVHRRFERTSAAAEVLDLPQVRVDLGRCQAEREGEPPRALTPREVGILRLLHRHRERAVARSEFLEEVWGVPGHLATRTVDMAILALRQKVECDPKNPRCIVSIQGVGYAWGLE